MLVVHPKGGSSTANYKQNRAKDSIIKTIDTNV